MSTQRLSLVFLFAALTMIAPDLTSTAHAFQQTMTCNPDGIYRCKPEETPIPVQWPFLELTYHINQTGSKAVPNDANGIISAELQDTIHKSFQAWSEPECSNLSFNYGGLTNEQTIGYYNGNDPNRSVNMVLWQDDSWPYGSFSAVALTTVTFRPSTGIIVDADIEMNGATYPFSHTDNPQGLDVDIRNTLTHEVGHFLGLDHSTHPDATMFPTAPPLEISKRDLSQDDINGLCHIYPLNFINEPLIPSPEPKPKTAFCSTSIANASPLSTPFYHALTALTGFAIWNRRRRKTYKQRSTP